MVQVRGPTIGIPAGTKEKRVDFERNDFQVLIETKGPRFGWAQAARCPCSPLNDQTRQPDYNCDLCGGTAWVYFRPKDYAVPDDAGTLTTVQQALVDDNNAAVVRGVVTAITREVEDYDRLGPWVFGSAMVTTRHENKLGHYDKLISLDSELNYTEIITIGDTPTDDLPTRYKATVVNFLMDADGKRFVEGEEFELSPEGQIRWLTGQNPPAETRLSVHYLMHPTWLIWEHPHAFRETLEKFKKATTVAPAGDPQALPVQALMRLEFLIERSVGANPP